MKTIFFLSFLLFLAPNCFAVKMGAFSQQRVENINIGVKTNLGNLLWIKNYSSQVISITITPILPSDPSFLRKDYSSIVTSKWLSTDQRQLSLLPGELRYIDCSIRVPRYKRYLGKKYQAHIAFKVSAVGTGTVEITPNLESIILADTNKLKRDSSGNSIFEEEKMVMTPSGGVMGEAETVMLTVPAGALGSTVTIGIKELTDSEIPQAELLFKGIAPISAYRFSPPGIALKKPVSISLPYFDEDEDGIVDEMNCKVENLKIYNWDGFEWRLLNCSINKEAKSVSAAVSHFSIYALFSSTTVFTTAMLKPYQKIITPASIDGKNDYLVFPGLQGLQRDFNIQIFDVTGIKVRTLVNIDIWDGKDEAGNIAESGTYIYHYKVPINGEDKLITGVVIIAK